mmetsp:Transcript_59371/g.128372  ORF Transcript_59371/g.128372 Transcript_59371/m.128372 type:complete len:265 (-) Transcript_59371:299-1093(-)
MTASNWAFSSAAESRASSFLLCSSTSFSDSHSLSEFLFSLASLALTPWAGREMLPLGQTPVVCSCSLPSWVLSSTTLAVLTAEEADRRRDGRGPDSSRAFCHADSAALAACRANTVVVGRTMPPVDLKRTSSVDVINFSFEGCRSDGNILCKMAAFDRSDTLREAFFSFKSLPSKRSWRPPRLLKQRVCPQYMRYLSTILSRSKYRNDLSASSVASPTAGWSLGSCRLMKPYRKPLISPFLVDTPSVAIDITFCELLRPQIWAL